MPNTKKYVSLDKLGLYDEKIKKYLADADKVVLDESKSYADGLASNYEVAGTVATAQTALQKNIDAVDAKADAAQAAADKAQGEVDALETLVGVLPEGTTATSVVEYVNKKTEGIATDAALGELNSQVSGLQTAVQGIQADYLKAADKTELNDLIVAETNRAKGIEGGLRTDVDAIKADYLKAADAETLQGNIDAVVEDVSEIAGDYLKGADKTELEGKIGAKVAQVDYDAKMEEIDGNIDGLQSQIDTIMNNPDTENVIDSINEFTQYIADHGAIADGFRTDINKNKDDIAALDTAYKAADTEIKGRLDNLEAIDHDAYKAADTALKNELNAEIAKKADATALTSAVQALEGADSAMAGRLDSIEAQLGDGEGSVADMIATAKQEAIDSAVSTAADDATSKANAAETAAKAHATALDEAMGVRVATLETASATHALASDLTAAVNRISANETAISGHGTRLDAVEALAAVADAAAKANASAIALKASQADLEAVSGRVTTLETWHQNFTEVSEAEINALFA